MRKFFPSLMVFFSIWFPHFSITENCFPWKNHTYHQENQLSAPMSNRAACPGQEFAVPDMYLCGLILSGPSHAATRRHFLHGPQIPSTGSPCAPQHDGALILYSLAHFRPFATKYSSMKLPFRMRKRLHNSPSWDSTLQFLKAYLYHTCIQFLHTPGKNFWALPQHS